MWKKVTTKNQFLDIKIGDVLLKYPVLDKPLLAFDEATAENIALRVVSRNDHELQEIDFVLTEQNIDHEIIMGLSDIVFRPIKKTCTGVIEDGRYWINK